MTIQLFSATGCMRCSVVKKYMDDNQIPYEELDIKAAGKEAFKVFYKNHRKEIFRGLEGIEFPILFAGDKIYQGVGVALSYLIAEDRLDSFVGRSDLSHGWISGINICNNSLTDEPGFIALLNTLKTSGLKIELAADGRNPDLLAKIRKKKLAHQLIFLLRGPAKLYGPITGMPLSDEDLSSSLALLNDKVSFKIILPISAFTTTDSQKGRYLTPEEASQAAQFAAEATGSKTQEFFVRPEPVDKVLELEPLPPSALFKYRTACRRYMVKTEIFKE